MNIWVIVNTLRKVMEIMDDDIKYGEVKTRKNLFPKDAREIVDKGTVGIIT